MGSHGDKSIFSNSALRYCVKKPEKNNSGLVRGKPVTSQ